MALFEPERIDRPEGVGGELGMLETELPLDAVGERCMRIGEVRPEPPCEISHDRRCILGGDGKAIEQR